MREPGEKRPERCDPADPQPVAGYVGVEGQLTIDDRIRNVVRAMVGELADQGPEVSREDLVRLMELDGEDDIVTPHQLAAMDDEKVDSDFDRFLERMSPAELQDVRERVEGVLKADAEARAAKAAATADPAPSPPAEPSPSQGQ